MKTIKISRLSSGKVLTFIDGEKTDLEFYAGTTNTETILLEALERAGITVETEVSWLKVKESNKRDEDIKFVTVTSKRSNMSPGAIITVHDDE